MVKEGEAGEDQPSAARTQLQHFTEFCHIPEVATVSSKGPFYRNNGKEFGNTLFPKRAKVIVRQDCHFW